MHVLERAAVRNPNPDHGVKRWLITCSVVIDIVATQGKASLKKKGEEYGL
jgi:hypothetical protein